MTVVVDNSLTINNHLRHTRWPSVVFNDWDDIVSFFLEARYLFYISLFKKLIKNRQGCNDAIFIIGFIKCTKFLRNPLELKPFVHLLRIFKHFEGIVGKHHSKIRIFLKKILETRCTSVRLLSRAYLKIPTGWEFLAEWRE